MTASSAQAFRRGAGVDDLEAEVLQLVDDEHAHQRLVLDDQCNRLARSGHRDVEHIANTRRELHARERLGDQLDARVEPALVHDRVARIPSREQHLDVGTQLARRGNELRAVDAWQADVGEDQLHLAMQLQLPQR